MSNPDIDGPQQVEVKDVTDSSALVTWSQPVAHMDRVTMSYGPNSNPSDRTSVEIFSPDNQYSVDSLRPDTEYQVSLTSRSGDLASDPITNTFTTGRQAEGRSCYFGLAERLRLSQAKLSYF